MRFYFLMLLALGSCKTGSDNTEGSGSTPSPDSSKPALTTSCGFNFEEDTSGKGAELNHLQGDWRSTSGYVNSVSDGGEEYGYDFGMRFDSKGNQYTTLKFLYKKGDWDRKLVKTIADETIYTEVKLSKPYAGPNADCKGARIVEFHKPTAKANGECWTYGYRFQSGTREGEKLQIIGSKYVSGSSTDKTPQNTMEDYFSTGCGGSFYKKQ